MTIPAQREIAVPLLELTSDGKQHTLTEVTSVLADRFRLSRRERKEHLESGEFRFNNYVRWASFHLRRRRLLVAPGAGRFQITKKGIEELKSSPLTPRYPDVKGAQRTRGFTGPSGTLASGRAKTAKEESTPRAATEEGNRKQSRGRAYSAIAHDGDIVNTSHPDGAPWDEGEEYDEGDISMSFEQRALARRQAHKKQSREFRGWIRDNYSVKIRKEHKGIDVEFMLGAERVCVEIKTRSEGDVRTQIRKALGQLLEYNYYHGREAADQWVIVTDSNPLKSDLAFIGILRKLLPKPLTLARPRNGRFVCHPDWP